MNKKCIQIFLVVVLVSTIALFVYKYSTRIDSPAENTSESSLGVDVPTTWASDLVKYVPKDNEIQISLVNHRLNDGNKFWHLEFNIKNISDHDEYIRIANVTRLPDGSLTNDPDAPYRTIEGDTLSLNFVDYPSEPMDTDVYDTYPNFVKLEAGQSVNKKFNLTVPIKEYVPSRDGRTDRGYDPKSIERLRVVLDYYAPQGNMVFYKSKFEDTGIFIPNINQEYHGDRPEIINRFVGYFDLK